MASTFFDYFTFFPQGLTEINSGFYSRCSAAEPITHAQRHSRRQDMQDGLGSGFGVADVHEIF